MDPLVLGLDGGGTKTLAVIAQPNGRIVSVSTGPGVNPMDSPAWRDDLERVLGSLVSAVPAISFAVLGLPGYGEVQRVTAAADDAVNRLLPIPHKNENDVRVALEGAFPDEPGTLVLAGTGSMVMAKDTEGRVIRVGGWGELFSDEGSAYWIGQQALRQASQTLDGRRGGTSFAEALIREIGADDTDPHDALMGWCLSRGHPRSEIAALARWVDRLAREGDSTAHGIMKDAAGELTSQLSAAQRQSTQIGRSWSAAGSVFESRIILEEMIAANGPLTPAVLSPVGGAVWSALRAAHLQPDGSFADTFTAELARTSAR